MEQDTKDKLAVNVANSWKMLSVQIATLANGLFALYFFLPVDQQAAILSHLPVPAWLIPIIANVLIFGGRVLPQKGITADVAAAKSDAPPTDKGST